MREMVNTTSKREPMDADKRKAKRKGGGSLGKNWSPLEDQYLCDSWKEVSIDAIIGANQCYGSYWNKIRTEFDEHKIVTVEYRSMEMRRNQKVVASRCRII
jgi:hypothetical protein